MRTLSAESHFGLLVSIVCNAEGLCEDELYWLGHRKKVNALCLLYEIYHRVDHPMLKYLNNFIAAIITRALAALGS